MIAQLPTPQARHPLSPQALAARRLHRRSRQPGTQGHLRYYQLDHQDKTAHGQLAAALFPHSETLRIDASLIGVVIRLAALTVVLLIVPMELPMLVHPLLRSSIICVSTVTFGLCFWTLNHMYEIYLMQHHTALSTPPRSTESKVRWLAPPPLYLLRWAIRSFGCSMTLFVIGIMLQWFAKWGWIG